MVPTGVYTDPPNPVHHHLQHILTTNSPVLNMLMVLLLSSYTGTDGNALTTTKDLDLYYEKIAKAFADIPDSTGTQSADELQAREENRIVGPKLRSC